MDNGLLRRHPRVETRPRPCTRVTNDLPSQIPIDWNSPLSGLFLSMNNPFQGDLPIRSNVNVVLRQLGTGSGRGCNSCLHTLALPQVGSCGAGGVHAWGQTSPPNLTSPRNESVLRPCVNGITWIQCEQAPQCSCHASRGPSGWGLIADALRGRGCRYNHDSEPWACQKERDDDSCRLLT